MVCFQSLDWFRFRAIYTNGSFLRFSIIVPAVYLTCFANVTFIKALQCCVENVWAASFIILQLLQIGFLHVFDKSCTAHDI